MDRRRIAVAGATVLALVSGALLAVAPVALAGPTSVLFTQAQSGSWTVPQGVTTVTVHAVGGSGGSTYNNQGGRGADLTAQLAVTPGVTLHVHVAGNGSIAAAGANGGGATGWTNAMGAGGGASDIRVGGDDLASRVLVAGGGGGADQDTPGAGGDAGAAGTDGIADYCGGSSTAAQSGTLTEGGAGGVACNIYYNGASGSLGQGGAGSTHIGMGSGGGGGGGYYGGGGGGDYQAGAGGSSYVTPEATGTQSTLADFGTQPIVRISWVTPPAASVELAVADSSLPANGTSTTEVTATIADQYGNATPGDTVAFTSDDPGVTFGSVTDHGDGTYSTVLTASHTAHPVTIRATDGAAQGSVTLTQTPLPQDVTFTSTPPTAPVLGGTYEVSATGGASGNPVLFSTTSLACSIEGTTVTLQHAGACTVEADQAGDGGYSAGHAAQSVTVGKASTALTFTSPTPTDAVVGQTYAVTTAGSGSSQPVVLTIDPDSATVCSIEAGTVSFTSARTCTIAADQAGDSDHEASHATQDVAVAKATQTVAFTSTPPQAAVVGGTYEVSATGGASGNPVLFSTTSAACSIDGTTVTFEHAGACTVEADQAGDGGYSAGRADQSVTVGKASTALTLTSPAPADAVVGQTYAVTTAGSGSAQPVVLTIDPDSATVCSIEAGTVSFTSAGTCTIAADQAGDSDHEASHATLQLVVSKVASATTVTTQRASAVAGQPTKATTTVSLATGGPVVGTVQFRLDGTLVGAPVTVHSGTASAVFAPSPGAHVISATFIPSDPMTTSASSGTAALLINKAATTAALSVTARSLAATVTPVAPGAGSPTGTVRFTVDGKTVGTAPLSGGVATLRYSTQAGTTRHIAAVYAGDANFMPSAASTARRDPAITATVTSAAPKTRSGWYHAPVSVSFTCKSDGAPLTSACPGKVVLRRNVAAHSISRTIRSADGGMDTVTVQVSIDRTAPKVQLRGITNGARYFARAPRPACTANDPLSGVLRCVITRQAGSTGSVPYTATATDRAGNMTTVRGRYTLLRFTLDGAKYVDGAYTVKLGRSYTLLASSSSRPRYVDAAPSPRRPSGNDSYFHRSGRNWALGITITESLRSHRYWNIGVKAGRTLHVLKIRVAH